MKIPFTEIFQAYQVPTTKKIKCKIYVKKLILQESIGIIQTAVADAP